MGQDEPSYNLELAILVLLLFPRVIILPFSLLTNKFDFDKFNAFLATCVISYFLFLILWSAQLGVYENWNFFALLMIPLALFGAGNIASANFSKLEETALMALGLTVGFHGLVWILSNRFTQNY